MGEVVPITEKKEELDAEVRGWKQSVLGVMQDLTSSRHDCTFNSCVLNGYV